jgi:hypothetical protein
MCISMSLIEQILGPKPLTEKEVSDLIGDPSKGISVPCAPYEFPPRERVVFLNFIIPKDELTPEKQAELCEQYKRDMKGYTIGDLGSFLP